MRYLCGIVTLMNDIDEDACRKTVDTIISNGCSKAVEQCLKSTVTFSLDDYLTFTIQGLRVFISKELENIEKIQAKLEKWLALVPGQDTQEIDRIYIIPYNEDYTYSGTYTPVLSYIRLVWKNPANKFNFITQWVYNLLIEITFYHEIGHHVHKHTFGQDKYQEKEADDYAKQFVVVNHKILNFFIKTLKLFGIKMRKKQYVS